MSHFPALDAPFAEPISNYMIWDIMPLGQIPRRQRLSEIDSFTFFPIMPVQAFHIIDQGLVTNTKLSAQESEGVALLQACFDELLPVSEL